MSELESITMNPPVAKKNAQMIFEGHGWKTIFVEGGSDKRFYDRWLNKKEMIISVASGRQKVIDNVGENLKHSFGIIDLDYLWTKDKEVRPESRVTSIFVLDENNHEMMLVNTQELKDSIMENNSISIEQYEFAEYCAKKIGEIRAVNELWSEVKIIFGYKSEYDIRADPDSPNKVIYPGCSSFSKAMETMDRKLFMKNLKSEFVEKHRRNKNSYQDVTNLIVELPPSSIFQMVNGKDLLHFISILNDTHDKYNCERSATGIRDKHEKRLTIDDFRTLSIAKATANHNFWK